MLTRVPKQMETHLAIAIDSYVQASNGRRRKNLVDGDISLEETSSKYSSQNTRKPHPVSQTKRTKLALILY